jgi:hypothetical protein
MSKFHYLLTGQDLHIGRSNTGTGNPTGVVTAGIAGELFWDLNANILYVSEAATAVNWIPVVGGIETALVPIGMGDWVLSGSYYYANVVHNLGCDYPILDIWEGTDVVYADRTETINTNTVRIWVPQDPDLRFVGNIAVTRIP